MEAALLVGGFAALAVLVAAPGLVPWDALRAPLALFAFVYPPGELARRALFPRFPLDALRRALVAVALGVAAICLAVAMAWGAGNRLSSALPLLAFAVAALAVVAFRRRSAARPAAPWPREGLGIALAVIAPLLALAGHHDPLSPASDSLDHVGSLRKRIELDAVFPHSTFYAESRENGPDARKGLLHGALALVAKTTATSPLALWDALPLVATVWILLALLAAARRLVPDEAGPLVAVALFLLSVDGGPGGGWLARLGHPSRMVLAPFWTVWALLLDPERRPPLGLLALLGFAMAAIHTQAPVQVAASAAFLAAFVLLIGPRAERPALGGVAVGAAAVVAGAAPYLALRAAVSMPLVDTIHTEPQGLLLLTDRAFLLNPVWLLQSWGPLGPVAVVAALCAIRSARGSLAGAYLAGGTLGVALLLSNPLTTAVLYSALGYLAIRLVWFTPHVFLLAGVVVGALRRVRSVGAAPRPAGLLLSIAILLSTGGYVAASAHALARRCGPADAAPAGMRAQRAAFEAVDRAIAEPSVIAADPATGYAIPALTRHWTVAAMAQHTSPNDPDGRDRLRDARRILSPYVNAADTVALLRRYGAEWVLLNASAETRLSHYLFHPGPGTYGAARAKVDARADLFTRVLDQDGLTLYRVTDVARSGTIAAPEQATRTVDRAEAVAAADASVASGPFSFGGGEVLTPRVAAGGSLRVASSWVRRAAVPEANRFLTLRLERNDRRGALDATPLAKLSRRIADRARGETTRTRVSFVPGDGFLPPDEWPLGVAIRDESTVPVPASLAPGEYVVKIRVSDEAFYPNLRPNDFVSMEDSYDGVAIGTVRVAEERETL
jgi:hypothetical protein